jgi:hypothetical protein
MLANIGLFLKFWQPCKINVSLAEKNLKSLVSELSELIGSNSHYSVIQSERNEPKELQAEGFDPCSV